MRMSLETIAVGLAPNLTLIGALVSLCNLTNRVPALNAADCALTPLVAIA
jgi:hypothetical protein